MKQRSPDYTLLIITVIIVVFGLVMLSSASMVKSQENFGTPYYYLKHQLLYGLLPGLFATWLTYKINYKKWKKFSFLFFVAAIIVLILVFLPGIGMKAGGAARWLHLGPISFQPSEMVKLGLIIYLAAWLGEKSKNFTNASETLLPFLIVVGSIMGLIVLQPNIGTAGTIGIIATVMYFSAGAPLWYIVTIAALGFGGFFGRGLGQSIQKFNYLPEVIGDSIFAIIAEEIGFVGVVLLIGLFFMFAMRGFKIAKNSPDNFGKFLAVGITSWIVLQSFINISAISGLIPLTGVPLPLISYGASGLVVSLAAIGVLLNISRHA